MTINASIIDQQLAGIQEAIRQQATDELGITDEEKLKSLAFVFLCVKTMLDLDSTDAFDCLTEGGGDFGVDALYLSTESDNEFTATIIQAKYKRDLSGESNFPENGINALIRALTLLFDPGSDLPGINPRLKAKIEEARSMIRDGYLPNVSVLACNNGKPWNNTGQEAIDRECFDNRVRWQHVNHDTLIKIIQSTKPVEASIQFTGASTVEDMNFSRVFIGKVSVDEIATLIEQHGETLLERNIRRYLGLHGNRVNQAIYDTLQHDERKNFYFYNNGITLVCDRFDYNGLQKGDYQVRVKNLQIINGGQTCMTIHRALQQQQRLFTGDTYVLVRLYQLPSDHGDLVSRITQATNSQNPVDLRDLKSNDDRQQSLEKDIEGLGYHYRRKRSDQNFKNDITSASAAEAILSVWRKLPNQAKFFNREHFGKLYPTIFSKDLNGTQTILAVLLYRIAENRRRRPEESDPAFVRYASCFIAMQMGQKLLKALNVELKNLTHHCFNTAVQLIDSNGVKWFEQSKDDVENALKQLYGNQEISMQQLSATFRRGDLIDKI